MVFLPLLSLETNLLLCNVHLTVKIVQAHLSNVSRVLHAITSCRVIFHFVRGLELLATVIAFFSKILKKNFFNFKKLTLAIKRKIGVDIAGKMRLDLLGLARIQLKEITAQGVPGRILLRDGVVRFGATNLLN